MALNTLIVIVQLARRCDEPGDGVGFSRTCQLDQVVSARTVVGSLVDEGANGVQLMEPRKDEFAKGLRASLTGFFVVQEVLKNIQHGDLRPHFEPEVIGRISTADGRRSGVSCSPRLPRLNGIK